MLKAEMLGVLASLREKFMGQLRVADVSRKGAKTSARLRRAQSSRSVESARWRFPGLAPLRWSLHADCLPSVPSSKGPASEEGSAKEGGLVGRRRDEDGFSG